MRPVLVVIGGLPAAGKSTVAAELARRTATTYLRVDRIEQAIVEWSELRHPVGPVGYAIAHEVAGEQLRLGQDVIVECVNPIALTRDAWPQTATTAGARIVEVEVVCSDLEEHRRRVEQRPTDVAGLVKPTWSQVLAREYEPWVRDRLVIDTAVRDVAESVALIAATLRRSGS